MIHLNNSDGVKPVPAISKIKVCTISWLIACGCIQECLQALAFGREAMVAGKAHLKK